MLLRAALVLCAAAGFPTAAAVPDYEAARAVFENCLIRQLDHFSPLCEPVGIVAEAIVTGCGAEFIDVRNAMMFELDRLKPGRGLRYRRRNAGEP